MVERHTIQVTAERWRQTGDDDKPKTKATDTGNGGKVRIGSDAQVTGDRRQVHGLFPFSL